MRAKTHVGWLQGTCAVVLEDEDRQGVIGMCESSSPTVANVSSRLRVMPYRLFCKNMDGKHSLADLIASDQPGFDALSSLRLQEFRVSVTEIIELTKCEGFV